MSRSAIRLLLKHESGMIEGVSPYIIKKKTRKSPEDWQRTLDQLTEACFVYVGNLSFFTSEAQIYEYFSQAGSIKRVIMGLNNRTYEPCGFCFVEYMDHDSAVNARMYLDGSMLDLRVIKVDIDDEGYLPGREFGKSKQTGGQIRDDFRDAYDIERGGWSSTKLEEHYSMTGGSTEESTGKDSVSKPDVLTSTIDADQSDSNEPSKKQRTE